jgi:hypothetical protein
MSGETLAGYDRELRGDSESFEGMEITRADVIRRLVLRGLQEIRGKRRKEK